MLVSEIMHKGIHSVNINDSVRTVAEIMRQEDLDAVPVFENETPVGIVTDRDIVISCVAEGYSYNKPIKHAMNEDVYTVDANAEMRDAELLMNDKQVSCVIVVDNNQNPIGMIRRKDENS